MNGYIFHEDPGHGWLQVPIAELDRLGIAAKISRYSYYRAGSAYLEEDCDLSTFARAKHAAGEHFDMAKIPTRYHQGDAPIRSMPKYADFLAARGREAEADATLRRLIDTLPASPDYTAARMRADYAGEAAAELAADRQGGRS